MKNNRKMFMIAAVTGVLILAAAGIAVSKRNSEGGHIESSTAETEAFRSLEETQTITETESMSATEAEIETESSTAETHEETKGESLEVPETEAKETVKEKKLAAEKPIQPPSSSQGRYLQFPYTAQSDQLVIEKMFSYSGYYIEDGTEDEVSNVAAILVTNTSSKIIEFASVYLEADEKLMQFDISILPAGASVLVMEKDRKTCSETVKCSYNRSEIAYMDSMDLKEDVLKVTQDEGEITVENIGSDTVPEIRLFYKNQVENNTYLGGIAYTVKLSELSPGEVQTVYPSHFDPRYGKIMMVRLYE